MKKTTVYVLAAAFVAGVAAFASAADPIVTPAMLEEGRGIFRNTCTECHELDWPLEKTTDRAGWEETLARMAGKGAIMGEEETQLVLEYLLAKSRFETKCSACHGTDRPLSKTKTAAAWRETVARMSAKRAGHISETEEAAIAAYLAVERGAE